MICRGNLAECQRPVLLARDRRACGPGAARPPSRQLGPPAEPTALRRERLAALPRLAGARRRPHRGSGRSGDADAGRAGPSRADLAAAGLLGVPAGLGAVRPRHLDPGPGAPADPLAALGRARGLVHRRRAVLAAMLAAPGGRRCRSRECSPRPPALPRDRFLPVSPMSSSCSASRPSPLALGPGQHARDARRGCRGRCTGGSEVE